MIYIFSFNLIFFFNIFHSYILYFNTYFTFTIMLNEKVKNISENKNKCYDLHTPDNVMVDWNIDINKKKNVALSNQ